MKPPICLVGDRQPTPSPRCSRRNAGLPCLRSSWDITELWWSDVGNLTATVDDIHEAYARQRILLAAR